MLNPNRVLNRGEGRRFMSELGRVRNCLSQCLTLLFVIVPLSESIGRAATINLFGAVSGTAAVDLAGRCASFPTVNATGTGFLSGLGNFVDTQSHCTNASLSFNQGVFNLTSTDTPGDSLFGTYGGTATLKGGLLGFTATLVVSGGTGAFTGDSGTLLSSGTLDETTGAFNAQFTGSVNTAPEPSVIFLVCTGIAAVGLIRRRAEAQPVGDARATPRN